MWLATIDVLNKYQSDKLVNDKNILSRESKTAFYGFERLKSFSSLDQLKKLAPLN